MTITFLLFKSLYKTSGQYSKFKQSVTVSVPCHVTEHLARQKVYKYQQNIWQIWIIKNSYNHIANVTAVTGIKLIFCSSNLKCSVLY